MSKFTKRMLSLIMTMVTLTGISVTAFAATTVEPVDSKRLDIRDISELQDFLEEDENIKLVDVQNSEGNQTRGYPGEGPAKPVSSVRITKVGALMYRDVRET